MPVEFNPGGASDIDEAISIRLNNTRVAKTLGPYIPDPATVRATETPQWSYTKDASSPLSQRVPSTARTGSRLWFAWYSNDSISGEGIGDYLNISYSDDEGVTVNEYAHVIPPTNYRLFDPKLWTDPEGKLWFFWSPSADAYLDGLFGMWASVCANPHTASPVWGRPFKIHDYGVVGWPMNCGHRVILAIDYWRNVTPIYLAQAGKNIFEFDYTNGIVRFLGKMKPAANGDSYDETAVIELRDGRLMAVYRVNNTPGTEVQYSSDNGATWTEPVIYTVIGDNPPSRVWLGRSPFSDRLVFVYNNATTRTDMTLLLSDDEGATWPHSIVLDTSANVSYPAVTFSDDGRIFVTTDRDRTGDKEIRTHIVTEADVVAGTATVTTRIISAKP